MDLESCLFHSLSQPTRSLLCLQRERARNRWTSHRFVRSDPLRSHGCERALCRGCATQRLPSRSKIVAKTSTLLPSKVGVTNGLTAPSFSCPSPSPGPSASMPTQRDPSGPSARLTIPCCPALDFSASIGYVSETPSCQWTRAVCPPSQKPPFPSASIESIGEIGIPSDFPKHLTARSVTWQRGASETVLAPRTTHNEPSGSSLML